MATTGQINREAIIRVEGEIRLVFLKDFRLLIKGLGVICITGLYRVRVPNMDDKIAKYIIIA